MHSLRAEPGLLPPSKPPRREALALFHKNMTTVYSNSIVIPPGNANPINDHDDTSKRGFDVYGAYQHALVDEDVNFFFKVVLTEVPGLITKYRYPLHWQQFNLSRSSLHPPMVRPYILMPF